MRATRLLLLVSAVALLPRPVFPGSAPCSTRNVLVTVVEQKANPVLGLQQSNFRAKLHRKPLRILSVMPWAGPARVLLLFDVSGSMTEWIPLEKTIGIQIIHGASQQTQFAMAAFSDRMVSSEPFTAGTAAVTKKISALDSIAKGIPKKDRKTSIFVAVKEGVSMFGKAHPGDVICLVTDGLEDGGQSLKTELRHSLLVDGIRLYSVYLIAFDNILMQHINDFPSFRDIRAVAQQSGGMSYMLRAGFYRDTRRWSPSVMGRALALCPLLDVQFGNGYMIRTNLPTALTKPTGWKLEVVGRDGKVDHRLSLFYPRLSPCSVKP